MLIVTSALATRSPIDVTVATISAPIILPGIGLGYTTRLTLNVAAYAGCAVPAKLKTSVNPATTLKIKFFIFMAELLLSS
jgi:hypothetical protein